MSELQLTPQEARREALRALHGFLTAVKSDLALAYKKGFMQGWAWGAITVAASWGTLRLFT